MQNRAKIFMPFDALSGFSDAIKRTEYIHDKKYNKDESILDKLRRLNISDRVEVKYYYNFEYISFIGQIKNIDYKKKLIRVSNSIINFEDIDEIKKKL